jgi:predicted outer membrane repeat protein
MGYEGLKFRNVTNLTLLNLEIHSCGYEVELIHSRAAMHVQQCSTVLFLGVAFYNSSFTALLISDTVGNVTINNCSFCCNNPSRPRHKNTIFPSGIHIQLSGGNPDTVYSIADCNFRNNFQQKFLWINPQPSPLSPVLSAEYGYGLGGGMGVLFMMDSENITLLVQRCIFTNNTGYSGAGLYIHFQDNARGNVAMVVGSDFNNNNGTDGGALTIGMNKISGGRGNCVQINGSKFTNNTARYGGGTLLFALHGNEASDGNMKLITFHNCKWEYNYGPYSPAVDIKPFRGDQFNSGYLPKPQFIDCIFRFNSVRRQSYNHTSIYYSGAFVISSLTVYFGGRIHFHGNRDTGLKLTSARVHLLERTEVNFSSNEGTEGGAIAMYGFSAFVGNRHCLLRFDNNSAVTVGGGIFYSAIEQREFLEGRTCFLQYVNSSMSLADRNYTLLFTRNSAGFGGSSIYATSFYSCFYACHRNNTAYSLRDFKDCIGTFKLQDYSDNVTDLRTQGLKYSYNNSGPVFIIPGQAITIPITLHDEFGHKTSDVLIVKKERDELGSGSIFANNVTRVFGKSSENDSLLFRTQNSFRSSYYTLPITFLECPPGFYFDHKAKSCNCSADNSRYAYEPVVKCNYTTFRALIMRGYWAGTCDRSCTSNTKLYVSKYTIVQHINLSISHALLHELPQTMEELNTSMCGKERMGVLCGRCQTSRSVYYHSSTFKCGPEKLCNLGSLFFLLSEIVPVIITFSIILRYNISFQSGYFNGFILLLSNR